MLLKNRYVYKHWGKRLAAFIFDSIGAILTAPFHQTLTASHWKSVKKILAIRLDHLGDVIMTRPALRTLRKLYPDAQIDLLLPADLASLFDRAPEISRTIPVTGHWFARKKSGNFFTHLYKLTRLLRPEGYDLAIDFRGDLRHILLMRKLNIPLRVSYGITGGGFLLSLRGRYDAQMHEVKKNLHLLTMIKPGLNEDQDEIPPFLESAPDRNRLLEKFQHKLLPGIKKVVIHPGAGYPSKKWSPERFTDLYESLLADDSIQIIVIGSEQEKPLFENLAHQRLLDLRGETTLEDLPGLFNLCHVYVGNDSGPAHIAAGQGIPVVSIFSGTNDWKVWHPYTSQLGLVSHPVPCSPCESQICPLSHHDCMNKITLTDVMNKIEPFLKDTSAL